jgi:hypothetical protein
VLTDGKTNFPREKPAQGKSQQDIWDPGLGRMKMIVKGSCHINEVKMKFQWGREG